MRSLLFLLATVILFACNDSTKEPGTETTQPENNSGVPTSTAPKAAGTKTPETGVSFTVDGVEIRNTASVLVTRDKNKLKAGAPFLCMLTSNAASHNNEYLGINFVFDTKPGSYPVVGASFQRGKSPNDEMYGALMGGKPKLTEFKVTLTECRDLGSNNMGGHKWSISGFWENISIKATPLMLMDKEKKHPVEVLLEKGSFYNLTFDDNWEELLEEGIKKMKESNN